jgi:hypothetical protein
MEDYEKEILECIRKHIPQWRERDDEFMLMFCGLVPLVEEIIGNKGFTIDEAVKSLL